MPKIKCVNDENKCPNKMTINKKCKSVFQFDMKKILKKRQAEDDFWKKHADLDKEMKVVDDLFQKEVNNTIKHIDKYTPTLPNVGYIIFDPSKYNLNFNDKFDITRSHSQQLLLMSIEKNELEANIIFNNLMKSNWSPVFKDIQHILSNWGADLDSLTNSSPLKCQIKDCTKIEKHNFELTINFVSYNILKNNKEFSDDELLTLAQYIAKISFDNHCGQMINVLKELFTACIETAFQENDDTSIITFAQELYSQYKNTLFKMVVDLFLPLKGNTMKTIYTYLTFKLYKSLLDKTNNLSAFPSNIKEWFVQDLVNKDFFNRKPKKLLYCLIHLLEHIVIVFDLYTDEKKLSDMYDFFNYVIKPNGLSDSLKLVNILDQWRLQLFRLHVGHPVTTRQGRQVT
ncbi:uncharacterized protein LOC112601785 [Melanaphis sacchari]|uniref:uncharacterized protein LOC112601785 n=1 Tax=Melanaphis sacchari TaxID=742174 RepID=UPI000DC1342F|nr:uncharacterized protein LOC112601785 [Melanaphis sacchari]